MCLLCPAVEVPRKSPSNGGRRQGDLPLRVIPAHRLVVHELCALSDLQASNTDKRFHFTLTIANTLPTPLYHCQSATRLLFPRCPRLLTGHNTQCSPSNNIHHALYTPRATDGTPQATTTAGAVVKTDNNPPMTHTRYKRVSNHSDADSRCPRHSNAFTDQGLQRIHKRQLYA